MKYARAILVLVFAFTVFLFALTLFALTERAFAWDAKVGVILPLTGEAASMGTAIRNGMELGYSSLPEDRRSKVRLIFEDDSLNPTRTISAYEKLRSIDGVDAIIVASSGTSKALSPRVDKDRVPTLAIATDPKVVEGRKYVMNFWVTPEEQVRVFAPEIQKRGYKKLARITSVHDMFTDLKQQVDTALGNDVPVALDEEYPLDVKDFKPFITKIQARTDIDGIALLLYAGQLGVFAKQARSLGVKQPLFGFEIFEDENERQVAGGALTGAWYVNADDPDDTFLNAYRKRYPGASFFAAGNGNDAALLMAAGVAASADREALNRYLHTVKDFHGALGTFSATADNRFTLPAAVKEVTADGFRKISAR